MAKRRVLVTGGAGFVGTHLVDALLARGDRVRVLDNLDPQVHGPARRKPGWLSDDAELVLGDVRDPDAVARAVRGVEVIYHLAAAVGVGQSMYRIAEYTATNTLGTANLLQAQRDAAWAREVANDVFVHQEARLGRALDRAALLGELDQAVQADLGHGLAGRTAAERLQRVLAQGQQAGVRLPALERLNEKLNEALHV